jgi:hypothetical protein
MAYSRAFCLALPDNVDNDDLVEELGGNINFINFYFYNGSNTKYFLIRLHEMSLFLVIKYF